jgi:hypothetical protein
MTVEERLRAELPVLAHEAPRVDVWSGVQQLVQVRRRRRQAYAAAVTAAVVAIAVVGGGLQARHPRAQSAQQPGHVVDLEQAAVGTLPHAQLVVGFADGTTYAVAWDGQVVRLPPADQALWSDDPVVAADGTAATGVVPGRGVAVSYVAGGHDTAALPGATVEVWAVLTPDGRHLLEAVPAPTGETSTIRDVELGTGRTTWSDTVDVSQREQLRWTPDGQHLGVLYLTNDGRALGVQTLTSDAVARHARGQWQDMRSVSVDAAPLLGWAPSPDGSRTIVGSRTTAGSTRDWYLVSPRTGDAAFTFTRPWPDRLLAWTAGDRLVWWRQLPGSDTALVLTTARDGSDEQTLYRVRLPNRTAFVGFAAGAG